MATSCKKALVSLEADVSQNKSHIGKGAVFKHRNHVLHQGGLWHLHTNWELPNIIEGELAIIAPKDIELPFYYVCCMAASRTRLVPIGLDFVPSVTVDVEDVNIIHPLNAVIASKVVDLRVDQASCCRYSRAWVIASHYWLDPSESCRV